MTATQLKRLQRLIEKWEKHLPTPETSFTGSVGVIKGQRYAYKRVLREIESLLRKPQEGPVGDMKEFDFFLRKQASEGRFV